MYIKIYEINYSPKLFIMNRLILFSVLFFCLLQYKVNSQSIDSKNASDLIEVFGNDHFKIIKYENIFQIEVNKEKWETITIKVNHPEYYKNVPFVLIFDNPIVVNYSINVLQKKISVSEEVEISKGILSHGTSIINLDLAKYANDEDGELLLILYIEKGEKWKGSFSLKASYINSNLSENILSIYPNPSIDCFTISCNETNGIIKIYNELGCEVQTSDYNKNKLIKHNLVAGDYTVVLKTEKAEYKSKLTVIK